MQRDVLQRLHGHHEGTTFLEMLFQIVPLASKHKGTKSLLAQVAFHSGGIDAMGLGGVQRMLYLCRLGAHTDRARLLLEPVLHDHRDARRSAAVLLLLYKRYIEPNAGSACGKRQTAEAQ